jgi:MFS family permease
MSERNGRNDLGLAGTVRPDRHPGKWLTRNVVAMALLSLFSDMSHEMITAVLPLFVVTIGGSAAAVGLIEGASDFAASAAKLWAAHYSDRIGRRKPVLIAGYALTAAKGVMALAFSWPVVLAIRVVAWVGRGMRGPVRDALLADSVAPQYTGRAFGLHRAADTVGAVLGPAIALGLVSASFSYREIFLVSLVPGAITIFIVVVVLKDRLTAGHDNTFSDSLRALPADFRRFLVAVGVFGLGNFGHTLLILRAQELLTPKWGAVQAASWAIALYTLFNVTYAAGSYPAGLWSERRGKRFVLGVGYLLFALMCLGFLWVDGSVAGLAALFALGGLYIAIVDTMEGALAADLLPAGVRATGYGVLSTVNGVGDLLSSLIVGLLWTHVSVASGFVYALIFTAAGALLLRGVRRGPAAGGKTRRSGS